MNVAAKLRITGGVQGVWYRGSTAEQAVKLGISGWVRNMPDGSVTAYLEGPKETLQQLIGWCHEGPRFARVDNVEVDWLDATGKFQTFDVRY